MLAFKLMWELQFDRFKSIYCREVISAAVWTLLIGTISHGGPSSDLMFSVEASHFWLFLALMYSILHYSYITVSRNIQNILSWSWSCRTSPFFSVSIEILAAQIQWIASNGTKVSGKLPTWQWTTGSTDRQYNTKYWVKYNSLPSDHREQPLKKAT